MFIKGMKLEHIEDGANCLLQVKLRQRTWQKYKRFPDICTHSKDLLFLSSPGWHTVLICRTEWFYHSSQLQPKISYCSGHASVASLMVLNQLRKNYGCGFLKLLSPWDTNDGLFAPPFYFIERYMWILMHILSSCCTALQKYKTLTQRRLN